MPGPAEEPRNGADESRDPLDLLAERFLQQVRGGEPVTPESFAAAHPEHAAALLDLLPTLLLLEQAKRDRESTSAGRRRIAMPALERLGEYRIVREVGRGGMGVVFEAVQESLGRRVALKVLPQASLLTGNQLERFRREAQTAAQLHHTNIVPVFDSGEADGFHYYAMQFIDGQGLDAYVRAEREAPAAGSGVLRGRWRLAAEIGVAVGDALAHAHALGTLHRDVKPANLLLDGKHHVWVTDFGLAKALQREGLTHSGDVLGTLQYMAPEQFDGQYDERSEVYALGATLYELMALQPAFTAATRSELIDKIRLGRCRRLHQAAPGVPRDLETIVARALAIEPRARYAGAAALADDLRAFLEDRPIAARRQSAAERFVYWCRRNRGLAAAGAVALLAVVTAAVIGWSSYWTTADALRREQQSKLAAEQASVRDRANLRDTLQVFEDVFDTLVGPDPLHTLIDDDPDGEAQVAQRAPLDDRSLALLERMLEFYDKFAQRNQDSTELRPLTARAYARVGAIQARLGDYDAAVAGYEQAIARLRDVTAQDVTRDLAGLQQELGQVLLRRGQPVQAAEAFQQSLDQLEGDGADRGRAAQRLEARAHYLLAMVHLFRDGRPAELPPRMGPFAGRGSRSRDGGQGTRPMPGRPPDRRPGGSRPTDPRDPRADPAVRQRLERLQHLADEARGHLAQARRILEGLLTEQPDDAESLFLEARCLAAESRTPGPDLSGSERAGLRQRSRTQLEQLVATHPDVDSYRFELAEALLPERRGGEGIADLQRAVEHATVLVGRQPDHPEYRALLARGLSQLGSALHDRDAATDRAAGVAELVRAADLQRTLATPSRGNRATIDLLDTLRRLVRVHADAGDVEAARKVGQEAVECLAELRRTGDHGGFGPFGRRPGERFAEFGDLLNRLGLDDLGARLRAVLAPADGEAPREPARNR